MSAPARMLVSMSKSGDLERRVEALEHEVGELRKEVTRGREDLAAARVLAGGADRDVAEIRGEIRDLRDSNNRSFNAMREDLTDLRQQFGELRDEMHKGFLEMRAKFDVTAAGIDAITQLLGKRGNDGNE